jgi:hypothetical protein
LGNFRRRKSSDHPPEPMTWERTRLRKVSNDTIPSNWASWTSVLDSPRLGHERCGGVDAGFDARYAPRKIIKQA